MIKNIKSVLTKDEEILQDCRVHWIVFFKPLFYAFLGLAVAILFIPLVGALILVMDFFAFYAAAVFYESTHLILTPKKVIGRTGFLSRDWSQLNIGHIETAYLQEPILGRIFGYSSVIVRGTGIGMVAFPYLIDGEVFLKKLEQLIAVAESQEKENIVNITMPAMAKMKYRQAN